MEDFLWITVVMCVCQSYQMDFFFSFKKQNVMANDILYPQKSLDWKNVFSTSRVKWIKFTGTRPSLGSDRSVLTTTSQITNDVLSSSHVTQNIIQKLKRALQVTLQLISLQWLGLNHLVPYLKNIQSIQQIHMLPCQRLPGNRQILKNVHPHARNPTSHLDASDSFIDDNLSQFSQLKLHQRSALHGWFGCYSQQHVLWWAAWFGSGLLIGPLCVINEFPI